MSEKMADEVMMLKSLKGSSKEEPTLWKPKLRQQKGCGSLEYVEDWRQAWTEDFKKQVTGNLCDNKCWGKTKVLLTLRV